MKQSLCEKMTGKIQDLTALNQEFDSAFLRRKVDRLTDLQLEAQLEFQDVRNYPELRWRKIEVISNHETSSPKEDEPYPLMLKNHESKKLIMFNGTYGGDSNAFVSQNVDTLGMSATFRLKVNEDFTNYFSHTPNGEFLAFKMQVGNKKMLRLGRENFWYNHPDIPLDDLGEVFAFCPDTRKLLFIDEKNNFKTFAFHPREQVSIDFDTGGQQLEKIDQIEFSKEGSYFFTISKDTQIALWDYKARKLVTTFEGFIYGSAFSPQGDRLLIGGWDGIIEINTKTGEKRSYLQTPLNSAEQYSSLAFDDTGEFLLVGKGDGNLEIYDFETRKRIQKIKVGDTPIRKAFFACKERIVAGDKNNIYILGNKRRK